MEEKDDKTCGREGDRHPFSQLELQDEFIPPITLVLTYISNILEILNNYIVHILWPLSDGQHVRGHTLERTTNNYYK